MNSNSRLPTIAQIAQHNDAAGNCFFDTDTLRFFGQRMRDFRRKRLPDGRIVVYAYVHRNWHFDLGGLPATLAVYDPETGNVRQPADADALKEDLRIDTTYRP